MIHNLWAMGYESYKKENPCQFKNELVQNHFTIFQPGLMGRAWSIQDDRPRPTTPDFNCSIFIFYFQKKLSFSNKFHQTRNQMLQLRLFTSYLSDVFLNFEAQSNPENHVTPTKFDML